MRFFNLERLWQGCSGDPDNVEAMRPRIKLDANQGR